MLVASLLLPLLSAGGGSGEFAAPPPHASIVLVLQAPAPPAVAAVAAAAAAATAVAAAAVVVLVAASLLLEHGFLVGFPGASLSVGSPRLARQSSVPRWFVSTNHAITFLGATWILSSGPAPLAFHRSRLESAT